MKNIICIFLLFFAINANSQTQTNDFYDDAPTVKLKYPQIEILGEIVNQGKIDLEKLPLRSIIYKETRLFHQADTFVGAYRYDGYSLYDILNERILKKKNEKDFPPIIDLYIEIENSKGEKVVLSWGEIYYPAHRHEILIATQVARIVPSKTKELWPLPVESKLVIGSDLISERNISMPAKITVKSYSRTYAIKKGMNPMYSKSIKLFDKNNLIDSLTSFPEYIMKSHYPTVFYGRGMGIHGTTPFNGIALKYVLQKQFQLNKENLQKGLIIVAGLDGYRCVFTYSEIFNRNDQAEILLINRENDNTCGAFSLFPACDFFSDRAIKSIMEIRLDY